MTQTTLLPGVGPGTPGALRDEAINDFALYAALDPREEGLAAIGLCGDDVVENDEGDCDRFTRNLIEVRLAAGLPVDPDALLEVLVDTALSAECATTEVDGVDVHVAYQEWLLLADNETWLDACYFVEPGADGRPKMSCVLNDGDGRRVVGAARR